MAGLAISRRFLPPRAALNMPCEPRLGTHVPGRGFQARLASVNTLILLFNFKQEIGAPPSPAGFETISKATDGLSVGNYAQAQPAMRVPWVGRPSPTKAILFAVVVERAARKVVVACRGAANAATVSGYGPLTTAAASASQLASDARPGKSRGHTVVTSSPIRAIGG